MTIVEILGPFLIFLPATLFIGALAYRALENINETLGLIVGFSITFFTYPLLMILKDVIAGIPLLGEIIVIIVVIIYLYILFEL